MPNPAAKYTDEFRRETADCIISTGGPITECCTELGLNLNLNPPRFRYPPLFLIRFEGKSKGFPVSSRCRRGSVIMAK